MIVGQKIKLRLNSAQKYAFENYFGHSRFVYNKCVDLAKELYDAWKSCEDETERKSLTFPNNFNLVKILRQRRDAEKWDVEWDVKISSQVFETTIENCSQAVLDKLKKRNQKRSRKYFLLYKKKKSGIFSCSFKRKGITSRPFILKDLKLSLPTFSSNYGYVSLMEPIRQEYLDAGCTIKRVYIRKEAGEYYAGFQLELERNPYQQLPQDNQSFCGIDVGVATFATVVDENGEVFEVETLKTKLAVLVKKDKFYSRLLSRKQEARLKSRNKTEDWQKVRSSKNYGKILLKLQRVRQKITRIKENFYHTLTKELCMRFRNICIEDFNASFVVKNRRLASIKASRGLDFYRFKRYLSYKAAFYGNNLVLAERMFPSTQICSRCGNRKEKDKKLALSDRIYYCDNKSCSGRHGMDRDANAAANLLQYGLEVLGELKLT